MKTNENGGRLRGRKFIVPTNLSVGVEESNAGARALSGFIALETATVAERVVKAGACLAGRAGVAEFGFGLAGDACLAALVNESADCAFMADMLGEPRYAAAGTGLFGFRPTHGSVSRFGLTGLMPSLEVVGLLGGNPADLAAVMGEISGFDGCDFSMEECPLPGFPEIGAGLNREPVAGLPADCETGLGVEAREIFLAGVKKLERAGMAVRRVPWPASRVFCDVHHVVGAVEASSNCGKFDGVRYGLRVGDGDNWNEAYLRTRAASFSTFLKAFLFQGAFFQFERCDIYEHAARVRARLAREVDKLFDGVDVIITPARPTGLAAAEARTIADMYGAFSFTLPASVLGCPALAFSPSGGKDPRDPGLQLMGKRRDDAFILSCGKRCSDLLRGDA